MVVQNHMQLIALLFFWLLFLGQLKSKQNQFFHLSLQLSALFFDSLLIYFVASNRTQGAHFV